jgi:uncharacterized delta-60 repeat protein
MPRVRLLAFLGVAFGLLGSGDALAADGDLYKGFSGDGLLQTDFGPTFTTSDPHAAVLDSSGRLVVVGGADGGAIGVARINPDGTLDSTFGGGDGQVTVDSGASAGAEFGRAVVIDANNKIVILGGVGISGGSDLVLARLAPNGDLDTTFDGPGSPGNGVFRLSSATFDDPEDVAISGTKIVIAADKTVSEAVPEITELDSTGALDSTFGGGTGRFSFTFPGGGPGIGSFVFSMAVQSDGKVVVSGRKNGTSGCGVARVLSNGSGLDTAGFNSAGTPAGLIVAPAPTGHIDCSGSDTMLEPVTGNIIIGGTSIEAASPFTNGDMVVARFTPAGALDGTFGTGGQSVAGTAGTSEFGSGLALQTDGSILLGGSKETSTAFVNDPTAARFTSGGVLDSTFGTAGVVTPSFGQDTRIDAMLFDPVRGRAYLTGSTIPSGGSDHIGVVALMDGMPDTPQVLATDPASPGSSLAPKIQGSVSGADTVALFTNDQCTGTPVATGTQSEFNGAGIPVTVAEGSQTAFWAQAYKQVFPSECSSANLATSNIVYSVVPTPPSLLLVTPASGANDNNPRVSGTGRSDTNTVEIFSDAGCTTQIGSGTLADLNAGGIQVTVPDNSTTTFYGEATGTYGSSTCSSPGPSYTEVTPLPPPPPPPVNSGPTGQRAAALKKCAKVKSKVKKKKCKKRARALPV